MTILSRTTLDLESEVSLWLPGGSRVMIYDTYRGFEWVCVRGAFRFYYYDMGRYAERFVFRGRRLPQSDRDWRLRRYQIPIEREVRTVALASRGLIDWSIAKILSRPTAEIHAIMEFHGYCPWNPTNVPPPEPRRSCVDPKWPPHLKAAIAARDEVVGAFRAAFGGLNLAGEAAMLREWEQCARIPPHYLAPGNWREREVEPNERVAATKAPMMERIAAAAVLNAIPREWSQGRSVRSRRR